ncbi:MAG: ferritin family protein [Desulfobacterales bacterium]|nr:ferritin family protein [Desulfobacterales bacterium]
MAYDFNADEIFEMAVQVEKNGANFYKKSAEIASDKAEKELLLELSRMEEIHAKTFSSLRASLNDNEKESTVFDPDGEAVQYLKALADTRVFFEKQIDTSSLKDILKAAIIAEKDSIVFYIGMRDMVPGNLGKTRLDEIIKEEMSHIRILSSKLLKFKN